jgi:hypothetical protein
LTLQHRSNHPFNLLLELFRFFKSVFLLWDIQESPILDGHRGVIYDAYPYASAFSQRFASIIGEVGSIIGRFVSTACSKGYVAHCGKIGGEETEVLEL